MIISINNTNDTNKQSGDTMKTYPLFNVVPQPRDNRDFLLSIPVGITPNLPTRVDLRVYSGAVENQLQTSSCVANATVSALEMLLQKNGNFVDLSRLFNYFNIRKDYSNLRGIDGGAYLLDGFKSIAKVGIPLESTWPFNPALVNAEPSLEAYTEALQRKVTKYERVGNFSILSPVDDTFSIEMVKAALAMGYPVTVALLVNTTIFGIQGALGTESCKYKQIINDDYPNAGGHAVVLVGYDDDLGGFITENSWGTTWGDNGFGVITYEVMKADCFDAWTCTAFAGVEFAPEWSFLPSVPMTLSLQQDVPPSYKENDLFYSSGLLHAKVQGGTPNYQYKWTASDPSVVFVTQGEVTKAQVLVVNWAKGESRSITVTCEVLDTSVPVQQLSKASVSMRVTKAQVDSGQAYRLYKAAFNRLPDIAGLAFWEDQLASGVALESIAGAFIDSLEFKSKYGSAVSFSDFIKLLYLNVLGREADAAGLEFWVNNLTSGLATKVSVLIGFSESQENKDLA